MFFQDFRRMEDPTFSKFLQTFRIHFLPTRRSVLRLDYKSTNLIPCTRHQSKSPITRLPGCFFFNHLHLLYLRMGQRGSLKLVIYHHSPHWFWSGQVEVAIKTLPLDKSKEEHIKAEIQHQLAMDHPNICRLLEAVTGHTMIIHDPWNPVRFSMFQNLDPKILCFIWDFGIKPQYIWFIIWFQNYNEF